MSDTEATPPRVARNEYMTVEADVTADGVRVVRVSSTKEQISAFLADFMRGMRLKLDELDQCIATRH